MNIKKTACAAAALVTALSGAGTAVGLPALQTAITAGAESAAEKVQFNGNTYQLFNDPLTWSEAKAKCEQLGGHLVTVTSAEEQQFVNELIEKSGTKNNFWNGGYKDGETWKWVTGESFVYTNWAPNEPNNYEGKNENSSHLFGVIYTEGNGRKEIGMWNDVSDSGAAYAADFYALENFGYICEWDKEADAPVLDTTEKPEKVKLVSFASNTSKIKITWEDVENADGYRVYRYNKSSKAWKALGDVPAGTLSYLDSGLTAATGYKYRVRAFVKDGEDVVLGDASNYASIPTAPKKVVVNKASKTKSSITLKWTKIKCTGYQLQMYNASSGKWQTKKTIGSSGVSTTVKSLKSGTKYRFRIRAYYKYNTRTKYGVWSKTYAVTTKK